MNWANRLTILRIILVPVFIMSILYHRLNLALVIFAAASITDALDGYLARSRGEQTSFGTIMDPIADKLLVGSAFVSFSIVTGMPDYLDIPVYVPVAVISRDIIILIGAAAIYLTAGKLDVKPTILGKITTVSQMLTIILLLVRFPFSSWSWNVTVVLSVISGLDYIRIGTGEINAKL